MSWIGLAISLACIAFFIRFAVPHWHGMAVEQWTGATLRLMALALLFHLATYVSAPCAWDASLRIVGIRAGYRKLARILMLSQFAKYLPGNVAHHVGRVLLAKRAGLPADGILVSMVLDTLILLLAAAVCATPALTLVWSLVQEHGSQGVRVLLILAALAVLVLAGLAFLPTLRQQLVRRIAGLARLRRMENLPLLTRAWLAHCLGFAFGGTALYLLCLALTGVHVSWLSITGIYTGAWLLGFIMPGAPAGLGIREVALLIGLSPLFGKDSAMAAAATLRLLTTTSDAIAFAIALAWDRVRPMRAVSPG